MIWAFAGFSVCVTALFCIFFAQFGADQPFFEAHRLLIAGSVLALGVVFNAEVVGEAGLLFAGDTRVLAGKMQYLLANPEVVRYYRKAGPERIKEFYSWGKVVEEYEKLLHPHRASPLKPKACLRQGGG